MADNETVKTTAAKTDAMPEKISICGGHFEIMTKAVLDGLSQPSGKAYALNASRGGNGLFAIVVNPGELPRVELASNALNVKSQQVMRFIEYDSVYWPEFDIAQPVFVFERPIGPRLLDHRAQERHPLNNEVFFRQAVESLMDGMRDLFLVGCNHGRINPTNLYVKEGGGAQIQLGEFLTCQPGCAQDPAYETIERMMAAPSGRGPTLPADDVYAIGVTLLTLLFGKLPAANLSAEELLIAKIEKTSLLALLNGMRLPSAYSELMRGLLTDDSKQRWSLDDVSHWLSGRRMGSKSATQVKKAQRAILFENEPIFNARLLAQKMAERPDEGMRIIDDNSLARWVNRSLGDEEMAARINDAIASATSVTRGGTPAERTLSRVVQALDQRAPLRFRDISAMPSGLGPYLATLILNGRSPTNVVELISSQLMTFWLNLSENLCSENMALTQAYDGMRMLMDRAQIGFGIERVAYELNPGLPCLSPFLGHARPLNLKGLMHALEGWAKSNAGQEPKRDPLDRHLAAFILCHYRRVNDRLFQVITPKGDPIMKGIALLTIYAEIQRKFHPEDMPHLANYLVAFLEPSLKRFKSRHLRERMLKDLHRLAKKGNLDAMLQVVDDASTIGKDEEAFQTACSQYEMFDKVIKDLSSGGKREKSLTKQGQQITAFLSCLLAFIAISLMFFLQLV